MSKIETNSEVLFERLFSEESSTLSDGSFSDSAWLVIKNLLAQAERLGHAQIGLGALLLSMIDQTSEGDGTDSVHELTEKLKDFFGTAETSRKSLELKQGFLSEDVQRVLLTAYELAENDQTEIEPQHLWAAVLAEAPHFLKQVFEKLPFQVEIEQGEEEAGSEAEESVSVGDWTERLSPVMKQALGAEDLTCFALSGGLPLAMERSFAQGDVYEKIARSLFRGEAKHVVLTGDKGVGKTVVLRELVRRAAEERYPFLADKRFLRLDCASVPP